MATRLKTIEYAFPTLAALPDNTLTALTQITIDLPEDDKVFKSVIMEVSADDIITATGGTITTKRIDLALNSIFPTASVTNSGTYTHSGENRSILFSQDFTSYFQTYWTGTSLTCDASILLQQTTGTTRGFVNASAKLIVTYEYSDTSALEIKTVFIPLDCPKSSLDGSKPGVANATIPALDTWLPESTKTIKNMFIVLQGNHSLMGSTTPSTISMQVDSYSALTTGNYEAALASDRFIKYIWNITSLGMTTNTTHGFYIWASNALFFRHMQAYLVVTYTFDPATTTSAINSLMLPMRFNSPMGSSSSSDYQRGELDLFVEEPDTITLKESALFVFWNSSSSLSNISIRVNSQAFQTFTDNVSVICGGNGLMLRVEDYISSLARGKNTINTDIYNDNSSYFGGQVTAFWIINYTSGIASSGIGSHNKTIKWGISQWDTLAASRKQNINNFLFTLPETDHFINNLGLVLQYSTNGGDSSSDVTVLVERLAEEGGIIWESLYQDISETDPETGVSVIYFNTKDLFQKHSGDSTKNAMDYQINRKCKICFSNTTDAFTELNYIITYHSIPFTVSGTISNSSGGTVNLKLFSTDDNKIKLSTSRSGNGAYSFTWFDNTIPVYVDAYESNTRTGRSGQGVAS